MQVLFLDVESSLCERLRNLCSDRSLVALVETTRHGARPTRPDEPIVAGVFSFRRSQPAKDTGESISPRDDRSGDFDVAELQAQIDWLRKRCQVVFALVDRQDTNAIALAYELGVTECVSPDCSPAEWNAKLDLAHQALQLTQRVASSQKLESIGELAAGIAHEINTPIQYVGDNTRFVQSACDDMMEVLQCCEALIESLDEQTLESAPLKNLASAVEQADVEYLADEIPLAISQTLEGVDHVTRIVRAMKEFSHPGTSEMTPTNLRSNIENTVVVAKNEWKYIAEVEMDFDESLPEIPCFPGELNQVLLNLIVNAAHAITDKLGEHTGQKGTIRISTQRADEHAQIRIADSGCGIPQENLTKIFAPFFTTKSVGVGTGQGLAIAHSVVVEKHGGKISVTSEPNVGTTFLIELPLKQQHPDPDPEDGSWDDTPSADSTQIGIGG